MASVIAVIGATGNQGGSVARSLHQNPTFKVRAITRNRDSDASRTLADAGIEVVQADGFNQKEMIAALQGAQGLYLNLNSDDKMWKNSDGPTEFDLGRSIMDAAASAGVKHVVFSSGPPCTEMTGGVVKMKAMDMKFRIEQYAKTIGSFQSVIPINAAWYMENFLDKQVAPVFGGFPHVPDEEGFLTFRVPHWGGDDRVPFLGVKDDYGDIVHGIFLEPVRWNGHVIHGASDMCTFAQVVEHFQQVTGQKCRFEPIMPSWEAFDTHGIPELEDVKLMFGFTQITGGRYFAPEPSEIATAAKLKQEMAQKLGWPKEQQQLVGLRQWFAQNFAA